MNLAAIPAKCNAINKSYSESRNLPHSRFYNKQRRNQSENTVYIRDLVVVVMAVEKRFFSENHAR